MESVSEDLLMVREAPVCVLSAGEGPTVVVSQWKLGHLKTMEKIRQISVEFMARNRHLGVSAA
jgi:hypothetical protein